VLVDDIPEGLSAFLAALRAGDAAHAAAHIAEYVILETPIDATPIVGRDSVQHTLAAILQVVDDLTIIETVSGDGSFVVVLSMKIDSEDVDGIALIGINAEGKVASLSSHLRPVRAVVALQNRLAALTGQPALRLIEEQ
jgi:hypothetical protein